MRRAHREVRVCAKHYYWHCCCCEALLLAPTAGNSTSASTVQFRVHCGTAHAQSYISELLSIDPRSVLQLDSEDKNLVGICCGCVSSHA